MNLMVKKDKYSILISIVFFIVGLFMFLYPNDMVKFITYIIGVVFVVFGALNPAKSNTYVAVVAYFVAINSISS